MSEIYVWVKNIIIFLILTTIINNLLGKSSYKKYINLITGIILVILVISPILKVFQLEDTLDYYFSDNLLLAEAGDMSEKLAGAEEDQIDAIFDEYKQEVSKQVSTILKKEGLFVNTITINVDTADGSNTYGVLQSMDIEAGYTEEETEVMSNKIEKIEIARIKIDSKEETDTGIQRDYLSPSEINAKNLLSDFYNINPDNINISIQD